MDGSGGRTRVTHVTLNLICVYLCRWCVLPASMYHTSDPKTKQNENAPSWLYYWKVIAFKLAHVCVCVCVYTQDSVSLAPSFVRFYIEIFFFIISFKLLVVFFFFKPNSQSKYRPHVSNDSLQQRQVTTACPEERNWTGSEIPFLIRSLQFSNFSVSLCSCFFFRFLLTETDCRWRQYRNKTKNDRTMIRFVE